MMPKPPLPVPDNFAARLAAFRSRADLSVYALAKATGVSRQYLAEIERGEKTPGWGIACLIADALGVSIEEFR